MIGILLTLLAVLIVICLAFCRFDQARSDYDPASQLPASPKTTRKKD